MIIEIYQIDESSDYDGVMFADMTTLEKIGRDVDPSIYKKVFAGAVDFNTLEEVFELFNSKYAENFRGRSMSVSDIVAVTDREPVYYYCDTLGFTEIEFDSAQTIEDEITVVMCEPEKLAYITKIKNDLSSMQKAVGGGLIQTYYPFDEEVCIICNEEGKINGMPLNRSVTKDGKMVEIMAGPFFICDCSEFNFRSLSKTQQQKYLDMFRCPELFFKSGNEIHAVPFNPKKSKTENWLGR